MGRRIVGPAPVADKLLWRNMRDQGFEEKEIPAELRDIPVAKSKKGPIGSIVLRRMSGLQNSSAKRMVDKFEENIGGKEDLEEKLQVLGDEMGKEAQVLLDALTDPKNKKKSLARIMAETGTEPTTIMKAYGKGAIELGKVQAAIEAHRNLPALIKDLYTHALSEIGVCDACGGTTKLLRRPDQMTEDRPCYFCGETGVKNESKLKQFAAQKLLEITKQVGDKGPLVAIQQNQITKVEGGGNVVERVLRAADEVLYRKQDIVEGEVVK